MICCPTQGVGKDTRGTAFIVYEDIYDAKMAVEHLSGFNVANRYLIVLYYNPARQTKKVSFLSLICSRPYTSVVLGILRVALLSVPAALRDWGHAFPSARRLCAYLCLFFAGKYKG